MWSVRRALIWALTLMICCAPPTLSFAQKRPKKFPKACKPLSEALDAEIKKSEALKRQKAQEVREAINATRAEGSKAVDAAQRRLDATDGALQEARREAKESKAAQAKALFDFSERNVALSRALGVSEAKREATPDPVIVAGVTTVVVIVAWEVGKWLIGQALGGS